MCIWSGLYVRCLPIPTAPCVLSATVKKRDTEPGDEVGALILHRFNVCTYLRYSQAANSKLCFFRVFTFFLCALRTPFVIERTSTHSDGHAWYMVYTQQRQGRGRWGHEYGGTWRGESFHPCLPSFSCCKNVDGKSGGAFCPSFFSPHLFSSPKRGERRSEFSVVKFLKVSVFVCVLVCFCFREMRPFGYVAGYRSLTFRPPSTSSPCCSTG